MNGAQATSSLDPRFDPRALHGSEAGLRFQHLALALYLGLFLVLWLFSAYLPEQFFRDQMKLVDSLTQDAEDLSSFRASALVYAWVTFGHPEWLVPVCAFAYVVLLAQFTRRISLMYAALALFGPSLMLNLIVLGKETLVTAMSVLVVYALMRSGNSRKAIVLMLALYAAYAWFVRPYYFAIAGLFLLLALAAQLPARGRLWLALAGFAVFCMLPAELYSLAAMHRDTANNYAMFRGGFDIRTMVHNLMIPDNPFEFLANYLYSLVVLNLPVLFFHGLRDALLTGTNLLVFWLIWRGVTLGDGAQRSLALLMLAHVLVLCLFEPDVGSYSRHLLSVSLYAAAALPLLPRVRFA